MTSCDSSLDCDISGFLPAFNCSHTPKRIVLARIPFLNSTRLPYVCLFIYSVNLYSVILFKILFFFMNTSLSTDSFVAFPQNTIPVDPLTYPPLQMQNVSRLIVFAEVTFLLAHIIVQVFSQVGSSSEDSLMESALVSLHSIHI